MDFSFSNAIMGDFNSYTFSLMGMIIVFIGLIAISLYIHWFPALLEFVEKRKEKVRQKMRIKLRREKAPPRPTIQDLKSDQDNMDEIMLAITTALHMEHSFLSDNQQYTWKDGQGSQWKMAGRVNDISNRVVRSNW